MIELSNATKKFGRTTAVDNVSFRVKKGEIVGFLGLNAAGFIHTIRDAISSREISEASL